MKTVSHITVFALVILMTFANFNVNAQTAFELPFFEDWQSWHFETNQWLTDGDNWQMDTQNGNDAPSAKFHRTPILTDYSSALTSNSFDASLLSVGRIFLNFDLKLTDNNETGTEFMHFQVFDGTDWIKLDSVSNTGSFEWTAYTYEITNWAIGNYFQIRFMAKGENSMDMLDWYIDNIEVYRECDRPEDIDSWGFWDNDTNEYGMKIVWDAPQSVFVTSEWKHYDNAPTQSIGVNTGVNFFAAIRWGIGELTAFHTDTIDKIKIFPNDDGFDFLVIKIWTGANASNQIYSDTLNNPQIGEWNIHELNDIIVVDKNLELWVGYEVVNPNPDKYPAGTDSGPVVVGKGDLVSTENGSWDRLSDYGFNQNWNIRMFIESPPQQSSDKLRGFNLFKSCFTNNHIYKKIAFIDFNEDQISYLYKDTDVDSCWDNLNGSGQCYKVNALWAYEGDSCTSYYANSSFIPGVESCLFTVSLDENKILDKDDIKIFPNPTSTSLNLKSESKLQTVTIFNLFGQKVGEFDAAHKKELQIDVSILKSGVYLLKAFDGETIISSKFIIQ